MERWIPLFDIFINSPSPETEASLWLQRSFNPSSTSPPVSTSAFLSLLTDSSSHLLLLDHRSSSPHPKRLMYIQTLPNFVQARILSFLVYERQRFCKRDLVKLARELLLGEGQELDFWVKKTAEQLLDVLSGSGFDWISSLNLDSEEETVEDEFRAMPDWLKDAAKTHDFVLPCLPVMPDEINLRKPFGSIQDDEDSEVDVVKERHECVDEVMGEAEVGDSENVAMNPEVEKRANWLRAQILNFEVTSKTVELANEISQLCVESGVDSLAVLELVEPWKADDETASIMIAHLLQGGEDELGWPSQILCSVVLPKMLSLTEPASRVLVSSTVEYCKVHQKAAEYALLWPLILKVDGINNPICDVISRIIRECLHPAHVSAFFHKLLSAELDAKNFICLPCHRCLIGSEVVWTESMFNLMQNVLNKNVHLTQDAVDQLVQAVCKSTNRFPRSLKLGNFLLCFINKCATLLKSHKLLLIEAVEHSNTLVTKSILSKLASL